MSAVLQRMAVLQAVSGLAGEDDSDPEQAELQRLAALMPADETQLLYSICLHGRSELGLAPDEYAALTMVLLRLLAFKPTQQVSAGAEKKTLKTASPELARPVTAGGAASAAGLPAAAPVAPATVPSIAAAPDVELVLPVAASVASNPEPCPVASPVAAAVAPATVPLAATVSIAASVAPDPASQAIAMSARVVSEAVSPTSDAGTAVPPGQRLPVVSMPASATAVHGLAPGHSATATQADSAAPAPEAIPVRVQADSARDVLARATPHPIEATDQGDFWFATVQALISRDAITAMVRELALQAQLVARDSDQWLLRLERESLNQPGSRDRLTNALAGAGHVVQLVVEVGRVTDSPAKRLAAAAAEAQLAAEKIVFDDPFVQSMMREFGAKIVPGSIKPL
jgi:DNA polymerase-3 subunit gamma/tau